jgi:hypothetical protein
MLPLATIRTDGGTQSREQLSEETVADYAEAMQAGAGFPPIVVFHDGSTPWLADGFHRLFAARKAGLNQLPADVRQGTRTDAIWYAIGANKANGQRPSRGDVKHAVLLALKTWPEKTLREIGGQIGCSFTYVGVVKRELYTSAQLPDAPATVTGRDGKTYPTSKPRQSCAEAQYQPEAQPMTQPSAAQAPPQPKREIPQPRGVALGYAMKAISFLQQIPPDDALRDEALDDVIRWIEHNR